MRGLLCLRTNYRGSIQASIFPFKKPSLLLDAATVSDQAPVRAHHTMARNDQRNRIVPDGAANRLRRHMVKAPLLCDEPCDLTIGHRAPIRDGKQDLPNFLPEIRACHTQHWRKTRILSFKIKIQPPFGFREDREVCLCSVFFQRKAFLRCDEAEPVNDILCFYLRFALLVFLFAACYFPLVFMFADDIAEPSLFVCRKS